MNDLMKKLKRKLIFINGPARGTRDPIIPSTSNDIEMLLEGQNLPHEFSHLAPDLFRDYDKNTNVLIKANLNSALPYPASVSMDMLETLFLALLERGVRHITVADCSGITHLPTSEVIKTKNLKIMENSCLKLSSFDYGKWFMVPIEGKYFKYILLPEKAFRADRIINLSNLKAHRLAGFSASIKNLVGFMHPMQRIELHRDHLAERIAEIPLAIVPDINIIDAREIFIDGGPDIGTVCTADTIIINSNLYEADKTAYELLIRKKSENNINDLPENYIDNPIFKHYCRMCGGDS
ncbi:MAG: DUF362 domain-containing protein [Clostridia bacterium]